MSGAQHTPMVVAAARVLCERNAEQCNVNFEDSWKFYSDDFLADAQAMLDAAGAPELLAFAQEFLADYMSEDGLGSMKHYAGKAGAAVAKATGGAA